MYTIAATARTVSVGSLDSSDAKVVSTVESIVSASAKQTTAASSDPPLQSLAITATSAALIPPTIPSATLRCL
ncbi:hypothetical protein D3C73_1521110 [compost metagenome]